MGRQDNAAALLHQRRILVGLGVLSCAVLIARGFTIHVASPASGAVIGAGIGIGLLLVLYSIVLAPLALGREWAPALGALVAGLAVAGTLAELAGSAGSPNLPVVGLDLAFVLINIAWIKLERDDSGWVGLLTCVVTGLLVGIEVVVIVASGTPELDELLPRLLVLVGAVVLAVAIRRHWNRAGKEDDPSTSDSALEKRR
ncbi:hypothetical protein [Kocuria rosea]|uniref:Uncharacterized protein n=1 Tax=Kocuria rosea TaxID=1275 RepID=A0A4R5YFJ5_KOCRO|nr:hypothetical protein [Kocuria rosea]TDL43018.1 hypothetical protein E2R59_09360 [Kocuria rosea]